MRLSTVVADDVRVVFAKAGVEFVLSKVSQQLNPPTVHHIFTEMHHAVEVVEVRGFRVSVAIFIHCGQNERRELHLNKSPMRSFEEDTIKTHGIS